MLQMTPIPRSSAVDACADVLRTAILEGRLAVGERLPPERALAVQFGVNRVTLRSALGRLARERLLSVRQGSGYVVQDFRRQAGPDVIAELATLASDRHRAAVISDLLLVRRQLARAVLERLAAGVSRDARARIAEAIDALEARVAERAPVDALAEADAAVLARVVEATSSAVLQVCLNPVLAVARALPDLTAAIYADAGESVLAWRALLAWLDAPSRERAASASTWIETIAGAMAARDEKTLRRMAARTRRRS